MVGRPQTAFRSRRIPSLSRTVPWYGSETRAQLERRCLGFSFCQSCQSCLNERRTHSAGFARNPWEASNKPGPKGPSFSPPWQGGVGGGLKKGGVRNGSRRTHARKKSSKTAVHPPAWASFIAWGADSCAPPLPPLAKGGEFKASPLAFVPDALRKSAELSALRNSATICARREEVGGYLRSRCRCGISWTSLPSSAKRR